MQKKFSPKKFDELIDVYWEAVQKLKSTKGVEYSGDLDRLRNFRQAAQDTGVTKETVLFIYMKKHFDAIKTYVQDIQLGKKRQRSEPISGRIQDMIVYLLLLAAMVEEGPDEDA